MTVASPAWLRIEPLGRSLAVTPGQTLLQAARAGGVELRSACRNGSCRECIARLIDGRVGYRIDWPGLSADEKAEGWVLPCVAMADSPALTLLQPHAEVKA